MEMIFQYIGIQIFSFLYLLLVLIVYFYKKRYRSTENSLYILILIFTLFMLIIDILVNYTIKDAVINGPNLFNSTICRLNSVGYQIWSFLLTMYVLLTGTKKDYKNVKELLNNKVYLIFTCLAIILIAGSFLFPVEYIYDTTYNIAYLSGNYSNYSYVITGIYLLIVIVTMIVNKNKVQFIKRLPIIVFLVLACILLYLQKTGADVPVLIIPLMSFAVIIMYFTLENPDMKMVSELNQLANEAREASQISNKFLNNISENIKVPINLIIGYSESLLLTETNSETLDDIRKINIESTTLLDMLNNTIDMTKIDAKTYILKENKYNLKDLILDTYEETINMQNKNEKINFMIKVNPSLPTILYGDVENIKRVISNLISNAFKYTTIGKIIFNVDYKLVDKKFNIIFEVIDTGVGIKEENYDKIFERFGRLDNKKVKGTGLGLTISKNLINLMGGEIKVSSSIEVGSTFSVTIPQLVIDNTPIGELDVKNYKDELFTYDAKILIVDDAIKDAELLKKILESYKCNCILAISFEELTSILKNEKFFDIIFIRHEMLNPNGDRVSEYINNKLQEGKKIGVSSNIELSDTYGSYQYDDYIIKPFKRSKINKILKNYTKK